MLRLAQTKDYVEKEPPDLFGQIEQKKRGNCVRKRSGGRNKTKIPQNYVVSVENSQGKGPDSAWWAGNARQRGSTKKGRSKAGVSPIGGKNGGGRIQERNRLCMVLVGETGRPVGMGWVVKPKAAKEGKP